MILKAFYPNSETNKEVFFTSLLAGILIYVLLIIYQPFGTSQFEHSYKYLLLFPYAVIATFSFGLVSLLFGQKRKWTIGAELCKILLIFLLSSTLSYLYNTLFLSKVNLSFENYLYMFAYTLALGFPVAGIYFLARYIYLNTKIQPVENLTDTCLVADTGIKNESNTKLSIVADYADFKLDLEKDNFVYAESADNYCILYFYNDGVLKKQMIRISLTRLLAQVQTHTIRKVHRSFIVNLNAVIWFKGNTSGYKILLRNIERELFISRNYVDSILPVLKNIVVHP